jgi:predicted short-subunit dehydrogenase-like oxidoreductase (DUF2520 family)
VITPPTLDAPLRVGVVAAGRVGTAVAKLLAERGHRVTGVWSRSRDSAGRAASLLGAPRRALAEVVAGADVVLVGASDGAIPSLAAAVAAAAVSPLVACHFAGSRGTAPLGPVVEVGGGACALHPVQTCPSVSAALLRLPGCAWGVTASGGLEAWASDLVRQCRGVPVTVAEEDRLLWHASAVATANGIVASLSTGAALLETIAPGASATVLGPLAAGALANVRDAGAPGPALTGPIARGETDIVAAHVDCLRKRAPELLAAYAAVAETVVIAAQREGHLDGAAADRMRALLERA